MGRIKDWFKNIADRLKALPIGRQGKAFVRIVQFFAIMVILTIFARGAAGATMPLVTTAELTSQTIRNSADYSGSVVSAGRTEIKLPAGLTVTRVHVYAGSSVKAGDDLVSFDMDAINENVTAQQIALQELRLGLAELQKNVGQDDAAVVAAQKAVDEAQKAYDNAVASADRAVSSAETTLNDAKKEQTNANSSFNSTKSIYDAFIADPANVGKIDVNWEDGINIPKIGEQYYNNYEDWYKVWNPYKNAKDAKANADSSAATAKATLDAAKSQRQDSIDLAQAALDSARDTLAQAQKDYAEATPGYALQYQKNQLEIQKAQREIEKQLQLLDELYQLQGLGGAMRATVDGTVTEVAATPDMETTEADHVTISTGAEGYEVQFLVPQDKARDIRPGNQVSVMLQNYYWGIEARVIGKSLPDEGSMITVRAQLTTTDWNEGDAVSVNVVSSDRQYWSCVPVAAVRPDSGGYYVLVVTETSTILGKQNVATKVPVTIDDQDTAYAAVTLQMDTYYDNNLLIIVSSNKPVNDGDLVRLDEASTQ